MGAQRRGARRRSGLASPGYLCHGHKSSRDHVTNTWNRKKMGNLAKVLAGHLGRLGMKKDRISSGARYFGDSQALVWGCTTLHSKHIFFGLRYPHLLITLPSYGTLSQLFDRVGTRQLRVETPHRRVPCVPPPHALHENTHSCTHMMHACAHPQMDGRNMCIHNAIMCHMCTPHETQTVLSVCCSVL